MNRISAGLALATAATIVTAVPTQAQAAPKNPVAAVKKQLATGKGVRYTERTSLIYQGERDIFVRRSGKLGFRKGGVAASDSTGKFNIRASDVPEDAPELLKGLARPERTIWVGGTSYLSGGLWQEVLPGDKKWFKVKNGPTGGITGSAGQPLNVAEPATLRTMLKNARPVPGGYAGKISIRDLRKVSPWFRNTLQIESYPAKVLRTQITWKLSVNAKGLPTKLVSTFPIGIMDGNPKKNELLSVDTHYSDWGSRITIKAPAGATDKPEEGKEDTLKAIEQLDGVTTGVGG